MKKIFFLLTIILTLTLFSCSSSVEETRNEEANNEEEETYVFDEIPENEVVEEEYYLIQIGAFTTMASAEKFAGESMNKTGEKISVSYNNDVNLFVVRIDKKFNSKFEAEEVRVKIRNKEEFKDAWIVSIIK